MGKRKERNYTEEFRLKVMSYYYSHGKDFYQTQEWSGVPTSTLRGWTKKYSDEENLVSLQPENLKFCPMEDPENRESEEALKKKIAELEKSLEFERMRSRAFEKVIEIAEREEGISILKKGGAKQ